MFLIVIVIVLYKIDWVYNFLSPFKMWHLDILILRKIKNKKHKTDEMYLKSSDDFRQGLTIVLFVLNERQSGRRRVNHAIDEDTV